MQQSYRTKQRDTILACMAMHPDEAVSAKDIYGFCQAEGLGVGLATVYRHMEKLAMEGLVQPVVIQDGKSVHYQFVNPGLTRKAEDFFLKCDDCGRITPLDCRHLAAAIEHMERDHGFRVNPAKSVFYGKCRSCRKDGE